ncbi:efflux RND transporter periplasmic adaptor subunit [Schaalia sp. ZJ405]|uniref:efflux RND transporter periplasmic adaptor subunit n=1 Tax=unclassified Schaalia TaxID=2691889 RepID=UPI0018CA3B64|nr:MULTISPECIES: efflux RND transporter periplasmic adaptor subunit [unclassified Schaalia]QPK81187.1 efflux RND transporter periplasmic adaptor subunit [Schaalia sp. ZJ405]
MAVKTRTANVLNILKTVIFAIIAIAFIKFAFFPGGSADDASDPLDPSADYGQLTVTPTTGDITNTVSLNGTIEADAPTEVKATLAGEVSHVYVANGDTVQTGAPVLELRKEMPGEDTETTDEDGNVNVTPGQPWYSYQTVYAPSAGAISLSALVGQTFSVGDTVASVQPPTFSAVATLSADQMYRLEQAPTEATITVKNGPAPFTCSGLAIVSPKPHTSNSPNAGDGSGSTSDSLKARCAIPADQKVFPGLQATIDIVAGQVKDALLVPISAVEGRYNTGYVYLPGADGGEPKKHPVSLGLTDGKFVQITEGLKKDQEILEFTPSASGQDLDGDGVPDDPNMMGDGSTGEGDA